METGEAWKVITAAFALDEQPDWLVTCQECTASPGLKCVTDTGLVRKRGHLLRAFQHDLARLRDGFQDTATGVECY